MKTLPLLFVLLAGLSFLVSAQDQQDEMMKAWQQYMTPGPMHELLSKQVGEWKSEITSWQDPSSPPSKSEGTSSWQPILGGRYFEGRHTGNFMGMEMEGHELTGYDNAKKQFFSTWIDNFGTGILYQEGSYNDSTNTFTYWGTTMDPMGNELKVKQTSKLVDDDTILMEMYMVDGENEFKSMEITFTRVK